METNEPGREPAGHRSAIQDALQASTERLAAGLHSPWWFHLLYGFAVACLAYGVVARVDWRVILVVLGLGGEIALSRWRTSRLGFSRANPSRFTFLRLGAPWSTISLGAFVAALALGILGRSLWPGWTLIAAVAAGLVMAAFGPLADRAGRRRLTHAEL